MKFDGNIRELGALDCQALKEKILSLDKKWWALDHTRQDSFDVHKETQSILMLFCEGWPNITIKKQGAWKLLENEAGPIVRSIIQNKYQAGGTILRAVIAKMPPKSNIKLHRDRHPSFGISHRIHVPLKTNDDVIFNVNGTRQIMSVGQAYEINNLLLHDVTNDGHDDRIHFIFDYMPPRNKTVS